MEGYLQWVQVTSPSVTAVGSLATLRPTAHRYSYKDGLQEYAQKPRLLVTRPREPLLRKMEKWSITVDHRGRVMNLNTSNIHQISLVNGIQRRPMSQSGTITSTMILKQSIEQTWYLLAMSITKEDMCLWPNT
jgi:hypothetical protein